MKKGYVYIFTGNGKGKTTAAIGLSVRAVGAGLKVYLGQFIKKGDYSEIKALRRFSELITVEQFGAGRFTGKIPKSDDIQAARKGIEKVKQVITSGEYEMIILDEANVAAELGLIEVQDLMDIIINKPESLELVITGRHASERIIELADCVTEFKANKHYYDQGVRARVGIDK